VSTSTVALRYAEALHAAARDAGRTESVLRDLAAAKAALDGSPETWRRLLHPRASLEERRAALAARAPEGLDPLVHRTLDLLIERGRYALLPAFFRAYLDVHEERSGVLRVELESATPVPESDREQIRRRIADATGRPVVLDARVSPELLGGLRLLAGSRLVDGSLQSRLERIARGLRLAPVPMST
jgi:F-type H+-transporting ATPase subunit delta